MKKTDKHKTGFSALPVAIVTAILTLAVAGGGAYYFGYLGPPKTEVAEVHDHAEDEAQKTLYSCGMHPWIVSEEEGDCPICGMKLTPILDSGGGPEGGAATGAARKIIYWRAPMDPTEIYEGPGKSKMGMDLVPVYEDEVEGGATVRIDPVIQQNMGVRTKTAVKGPLARTIRTYGHVAYDETRTTQVNPKFSGWLEEVQVNFTGQIVGQGQPLFEIYSPELVTAQEEYLIAHKSAGRFKGESGGGLLAAARRRLLYYDIPVELLKEIERTGEVRRTVTIYSPFQGVVVENHAVRGAYVKAGSTLYKIADLKRIWAEAHIYEYEVPWVTLGQQAEMTFTYKPGKTYRGEVKYIYPYLQQATRDVVVRLEFDNPDLELKPYMYGNVRIKAAADREGLIIPVEAVIRSGERNLVFVDRGDGKFAPREVTLGLSLDGGLIEVLTGLAEGEPVVVSGQFLLDSESKLKEAVQKMLEAKTARPAAEPAEPAEPPADEGFFEDM